MTSRPAGSWVVRFSSPDMRGGRPGPATASDEKRHPRLLPGGCRFEARGEVRFKAEHGAALRRIRHSQHCPREPSLASALARSSSEHSARARHCSRRIAIATRTEQSPPVRGAARHPPTAGKWERQQIIRPCTVGELRNLPGRVFGFRTPYSLTPYRLIATYFVSRYSRMPSLPPSRPTPDCLTPPKGAPALDTIPWLRPTIPVSSPSITRRARLRSRV